MLRWLASYLSDRHLCVKFAGAQSSEFQSTSGVPQGSLLGPYLFSLFVNDLPEVMHADSLMFADDVKVFSTVSSQDDCLRIQRSLEDLDRWCIENRMDLNFLKCQVITFHRCASPLIFNYRVRGEVLSRVQEIKDLGVIFTSTLNPETHILTISRRANRMLGFILRFSKHLRDMTALKTLYCALVRQILEYCSTVWSPHQKYLCDELERIQRRFVRMVGVRNGIPYHQVPVEDLSRVLGLQPLEDRRTIADLAVLHKILNGSINCPEILRQIQLKTPSCTCSRDLFARLHHRTNQEANGAVVARMQRAERKRRV